MALIAGADGCKTGWIALILDTETRNIESGVFSTVSDLLCHFRDVCLIAIDIPIGLSDNEDRGCDLAARKFLGGIRGRSVFNAPIRPLIEKMRKSQATTSFVTPGDGFNYSDACSLSATLTGKKISIQTWGICPKILELDNLLIGSRELPASLIEVHPEVTFAAWAGEPILEPKKKAPGFERRRALVESHFGPTAFDAVRSRYLVKHVAHDDILDAFAALWTAERELDGSAQRLPDSPPRDSRGLPMQIVY